MTLFVKAGKDWFYYLTPIDSLDNNGQEMIMRSIDTETTFPEEIIDYYDCPYEVDENYLAVVEYGKSSHVYFDGLIGDDELQFTQVNTDTENTLFITNRLGQGSGFFIPPRLTKLKAGDVVTLNGAKSTVLHSNDATTLLSQNSGMELYLTDYLIEIIY